MYREDVKGKQQTPDGRKKGKYTTNEKEREVMKNKA